MTCCEWCDDVLSGKANRAMEVRLFPPANFLCRYKRTRKIKNGRHVYAECMKKTGEEASTSNCSSHSVVADDPLLLSFSADRVWCV
jgi:hypothetical protein